MKKTICICICICISLVFGCGKLNSVVQRESDISAVSILKLSPEVKEITEIKEQSANMYEETVKRLEESNANLQQRFDTFKRHTCYYVAAITVLALAMAYLYLGAGSGEDLALRMVAELQERLVKVGNLLLRADRERLDTNMFYEWLEQYMPPETWNYWRQAFLRFMRGER